MNFQKQQKMKKNTKLKQEKKQVKQYCKTITVIYFGHFKLLGKKFHNFLSDKSSKVTLQQVALKQSKHTIFKKSPRTSLFGIN